jgi:hypothetical protein
MNRKRKRRKRKKKLPKKILIIKNEDKTFHEKWTEGRDELNIPHPFRAVLMGPPGKGKTNIIKNLLLRQDPPFKEVIVVHCDADFTKEYDDIDPSALMGKIPPKEFFDGEDKTLVILDDLDFKNMKGNEKTRLNRLYGNWSTHKNISVALCSQDTFQVPPIVRRCSNFWILWKGLDIQSLQQISKKVGMRNNKLEDLFDIHVKKDHDAIWIDLTKNTPYPLRLNGYKLIE